MSYAKNLGGHFTSLIFDYYKAITTIEIYCLQGNHDRLTKGNDEDLMRMGGVMFMMIIQECLKHYDIKLHNLRAEWNFINCMGFNFLIHHGDFGASGMIKRKPMDILWEYGDQRKCNVILAGHEHHSEMKDVAKNATTILCPGLAGPGSYDKRLLLTSYPGYIEIQNIHGLPKNSFIRLP